ncbi:MAG: N-acetyltransferase [Gemmatimonadota bacterium]|nr:MAG: N-acetyltransferase [Gemmatimonadota bacterium]
MSEGVFVHEKGMCESDSVGDGTRIWAHAHVMKGAVVGRGCNIGEGSFVESGAVLGDFCTVKNGVSVWDLVVCEDYVFLGPDSCFTNDFLPRAAFKKDPAKEFRPTRIREGASIGANATIVCGITIGRHAMVGAGAVVTRDVPDFSLVIGSPAKPIGFVGRYGNRLTFDEKGTARCEETGDLYRLREGAVMIETMGMPPTRK